MKKEDFVALVQASGFLGAERQKLLTENAGWMTAKEREILAKRIAESGSKIEKNNEEALGKLEVIAGALKDFRKKELPKLVKAKEKEERVGEEAEAASKLKEY